MTSKSAAQVKSKSQNKTKTMSNQTKLIFIKVLHTLIWLFFNVVIIYMIYAVLINKIDIWLWLGYVSFAVEGIILLVFGMHCPLTLVAGRFTDNHTIGFDIYLPSWLAKYNKIIYSIILGFITLATIYRVLST
jgi:hypothetical protein